MENHSTHSKYNKNPSELNEPLGENQYVPCLTFKNDLERPSISDKDPNASPCVTKQRINILTVKNPIT